MVALLEGMKRHGAVYAEVGVQLGESDCELGVSVGKADKGLGGLAEAKLEELAFCVVRFTCWRGQAEALRLLRAVLEAAYRIEIAIGIVLVERQAESAARSRLGRCWSSCRFGLAARSAEDNTGALGETDAGT